MKLYSIYDKQHEIHGPIFEFHNDELAKRFFKSLSDNPESQVHKYPQDYKLVQLGTIDKTEGTIIPKREGLT